MINYIHRSSFAMSRLSVFVRRVSVATSSPPLKPSGPDLDQNGTLQRLTKSLLQKSEGWMGSYEEFIGIKQVKEAHARVLTCENEFVKAQEDRRQAQILMNSMQLRLREVRTDLDRTPRGDNNYLELVKREIELIRDERSLRDKFETEERRERELFNILSSALRFSHEKERAQTEKTKYWSIIASLIGASLGIVGTTINSQLRLRKLRQMLTENTEASAVAVLSKIEQVTSGDRSASVLQKLNDLRELISSERAVKEPLTNDSLYATLEERLKKEEERRRRDLAIATASILLIVPILIIKFSSS